MNGSSANSQLVFFRVKMAIFMNNKKESILLNNFLLYFWVQETENDKKSLMNLRKFELKDIKDFLQYLHDFI